MLLPFVMYLLHFVQVGTGASVQNGMSLGRVLQQGVLGIVFS